MMLRFISFYCFLFFTQLLFAQSRFSAEPTFRNLQRSTDFGTLHDYIHIKNNTKDTLQMRWISRPTGGDTAWDVNLQDPENFYSELTNHDSANFILPDTASGFSRNLMVIGVAHNQFTGFANYRFTLFEQGRRADSMRINFWVTVTPGMGLEGSKNLREWEIYPQPAREKLYIDNLSPHNAQEVQLYNSRGEIPAVDLSSLEEGYLDVSSLTPGVYLLFWEQGKQYEVHKIIIQPWR